MNLLEKNKNYKPKNFSLSMGDWDEENCKTEWNGECGLQNLENGQYPFYINNTSWYKISDIPKQINTVNTEEGKFTKQVIKGVLTVKDCQIDLEELDKQIPENYGQYNTHIFLENLDINEIPEFKMIEIWEKHYQQFDDVDDVMYILNILRGRYPKNESVFKFIVPWFGS